MRDDLARVAWPIWNRAERRPRALVRLLIHGLLLAVAGNGVQAALFVLPQQLGAPEPLVRSAFEPAFYGVLLFSVIVVTWACARFVDRRPFAALGLRPRRGYLTDVALGTLIAVTGVLWVLTRRARRRAAG